ncbi:MAG: tetratricopeptide repeat protein, partial [Pseudomonadota bacterium]|nr:tetratricopeptide repeat protein [Pseudomonadota bacterium]
LRGWLPVVKSDLEKRIKARKLGKVIKQLRERADKFMQEGRFDAAVGEYLKILTIDPDNWRGKHGLRKLALKIPDENAAKAEGAREKAEAVYLKALRLFPDYPDNYGDPAGFYIESERPAQIEVILKEAGQKFTPEKSSFFTLGELYQKRKDFTKTLANYKAVYSLQPDKTSLLADLIKAYNELGDYQPVTVSQKRLDLELADIDIGYEPIEPSEPPENHLKALKKGVDENPTNAGYHAALAEYYTGYNLLDVAVKHYQLAVNNDSLNDYRLRTLADAWLRLGNNEEAEKALLAACKVKPDSSLSVAKLALFYEFSKDVKVAEKVLLQAVRDYPKDLNLHFTLARFYERQEELDKALIEVHKVLEFDGKKIKAHTLLGRIYKKMGRAEAAFQEFAYRESILRQKIAKEPQKEGHYNALAWFLADVNINLDEALFMAWESKTLGWVYYQRGDYGRAVKYMNQAITEDGDRADCFFRLSMALSRVGKKSEAEAAFKIGKLKDPCSVLGLRAAGILAQKPAQ